MSPMGDPSPQNWKRETSLQDGDDFKTPSLNKEKELLHMANEVAKITRVREIKNLKRLADDEYYIEIFEKEFKEVDFHDLKGAQSTRQKAENLQVMIEFLGNAVYEMDLSHIEPAEILKGNYDHINRFVKLLHEWSITHSSKRSHKPMKKILDMGASGQMPTADTYENLKNQTEDKEEIIDFYKRGRPELNVEIGAKGTSKFRILSNDKCENNEIFQNIVKTSETPTIRSSLTTSVNTTFLGAHPEAEKKDEN